MSSTLRHKNLGFLQITSFPKAERTSLDTFGSIQSLQDYTQEQLQFFSQTNTPCVASRGKHFATEKELYWMKAVTDSKHQNTMAWPKSTDQKSVPLHKIPERPRKTLDTQNSLAMHQLYFCLWDEATATWITILIWNRAVTGQDQTSSENIYSAATQAHTSTGSQTCHWSQWREQEWPDTGTDWVKGVAGLF